MGPLGVKTLDPSDMRYRPNYDNSADSDDFDSAKGFNYHNGPEWIWPRGYYLRAELKIGQAENRPILEMKNEIQRNISLLKEHLAASPWRGLPELTNENGAPCRDRFASILFCFLVTFIFSEIVIHFLS